MATRYKATVKLKGRKDFVQHYTSPAQYYHAKKSVAGIGKISPLMTESGRFHQKKKTQAKQLGFGLLRGM